MASATQGWHLCRESTVTLLSFPARAGTSRPSCPSTPLPDLIELFLEHRRLADRAAETLRLYSQQLGVWHAWHVEHGVLREIPIEEFRAYFVYLREDYTPYQ